MMCLEDVLINSSRLQETGVYQGDRGITVWVICSYILRRSQTLLMTLMAVV